MAYYYSEVKRRLARAGSLTDRKRLQFSLIIKSSENITSSGPNQESVRYEANADLVLSLNKRFLIHENTNTRFEEGAIRSANKE
ncbi:hypothetical protein AXF42_Ash009510 [Apostasia shenzhenica]|uniref:Uncharacterized protein n=1 Tax=Apostasia shenzhenica TaxID=1088818 RepID=A0A2I0B916_9ASPA|nr:hypothetical protein AXF42_Ash009510 [Apostasia shenzhenica]